VIVDTSQPVLIRQAAIESFYVNVRTLLEFFGVWQPKAGQPKAGQPKKDSTAVDILPTWSHNLTPAAEARLLEHWLDASKHLVHFSKTKRTQEVRPTEAYIRAVADDVLVVWDRFATLSAVAGRPVTVAQMQPS
jgi:hypothetical protein